MSRIVECYQCDGSGYTEACFECARCGGCGTVVAEDEDFDDQLGRLRGGSRNSYRGRGKGEGLMRIGDVPHACTNCGHKCRFEDCNLDDPIGDGVPGCPMSDCGGEMKMITEKGGLHD